MRETTCNCCIDIVTIRKQPERLVAKVRMTHATLLRSRMNGNVHVRFCSRVEVATPRLRQRVGKQYKGSQRMRKLTTENVRGVGEIDPSCKTPLSREPCAVKVARTGLTGGMGKRAGR